MTPVIADRGGELWEPRPKIATEFGCSTHFNIFSKVPCPNTDIFLSKLGELESWGNTIVVQCMYSVVGTSVLKYCGEDQVISTVFSLV